MTETIRIIEVRSCGECPYAEPKCTIFSREDYISCARLWHEVDPDKIHPSCPLPDHTPAGVALTDDGRTVDVFVEGNEVIE